MSPSISEILDIREEDDFATALSDLVSARYQAVGYSGLRPGERVALCLERLEREVRSGGFSQYFFSAFGDLSQETLAALQEIGAEHLARVLERAMGVFPEGRPLTDCPQRQAQLAALGEEQTAALRDLDGEFYESRDDLTSLVRAWVRAHQQDFEESNP